MFEKYLKRYSKREVPLHAPSAEEWDKMETELNFHFPPEYRVFVDEAVAVYFEGEIPVCGVDRQGGWLNILLRERGDSDSCIPMSLIPFCGVGNGDYHCFRRTDMPIDGYDIVYWDHEVGSDFLAAPESWLADSFSEWLIGYSEDRF